MKCDTICLLMLIVWDIFGFKWLESGRVVVRCHSFFAGNFHERNAMGSVGGNLSSQQKLIMNRRTKSVPKKPRLIDRRQLKHFKLHVH